MRYIRTLLVLVAAVLCFVAIMPHQASAWGPFSGVDCAKGQGSAVCTDGNKTVDPITGSDGLIMRVVNIVAFASGIIAVIIIVLSGLRFVTSSSNSEDIAGARRTLIYALVGLVVIVLARTIVSLVLSKL